MCAGVNSRAVRTAARPDRPGADDRDGVARLDAAGEDADLVRSGKNVGEEEHLLVAQFAGHLVDGRVGERNARKLGLQAVTSAFMRVFLLWLLASLSSQVAAAASETARTDAAAFPHGSSFAALPRPPSRRFPQIPR
jgi:hypothetical protein